MITISLDEYGLFERDNLMPMFIGGLFFDDAGLANETETERKRIEKYYRNVISDCDSFGYSDDFSYPSALHSNSNKNRDASVIRFVKTKLTNTLGEILSKGTYKGKALLESKRRGNYHLFVLLKSEDGKQKLLDKTTDKFVKDDFAANRYYHMVSTVVDHLVFNNPLYLNKEMPSVSLDIATRTSEDYSKETGNEKIRQFRQTGYDERKSKEEGKVYFTITSPEIYRTIIAEQALNGKAKIQIESFNACSINYKNPQKMEFLYLADTVCSILEYSLRTSDNPTVWKDQDSWLEMINSKIKELNCSAENLVFCYDEIDNYFSDATALIARHDYYGALSTIFDAKCKTGKCAEFYKSNWFPRLEEKIRNDVNLKRFEKGASDLSHLTIINNLDKDRLAYLLEQYEQMIPFVEKKIGKNKSSEYVGRVMFNIYEAGVSAYCHLGMPQKAYEYYEKCKEYAPFVGIDSLLRLNKKLAVSYEDLFGWEEALKIAQDTLNYQSMLSEIKAEIFPGAKGQLQIDESIACSQLARIFSYMRSEEAEKYYLQALEKYSEKNANYRITQSYLLHYYIDMGKKESFEKEATDYFGGEETYKKRVNYILKNCADEDSNIDMEYALYVCIRGLFAFSSEQIDDDFWEKLKSLDERVLKKTGKSAFSHHPWELIFKYLEIIAHRRGLPEDENVFKIKRKESVPKTDNYNVIVAIDKYSDIEVASEKKELKERDKAVDDLINYLMGSLDNIDKKKFFGDAETKHKEIQNYFTFMFR